MCSIGGASPSAAVVASLASLSQTTGAAGPPRQWGLELVGRAAVVAVAGSHHLPVVAAVERGSRTLPLRVALAS
jgi:hypothetical protein